MDISSLPVRNVQARDCKLTKEGLREGSLKFTDFCPSCADFGVRCEVGNHRSSLMPPPEAPSWKLKDGIPALLQTLSFSSPSVPSEKTHASCGRDEIEFPFVPNVSEEILNAPCRMWTDDTNELEYTSEADIVFIVRIFLSAVLKALDLDSMQFRADIGIKQIRPDLCVLMLRGRSVGVVGVKKPGNNVLLEPTVLGELLDKMLLVEGFYGMGPVIGILTTAEEWLISWFPVHSEALSRFRFDPTEASSFTNPVKKQKLAERRSPPGGTPSQQLGTIHSVGEVMDNSTALDDEGTAEMDRRLCVTRVMNIYKEPICVLQHLCAAFQIMSKAHLYHSASLPRCLFKLHKGISSVTFHPVSYDEVYSKVDFNIYPSENTKTLVALEDLGRGSTGKAWLCVTATKPRSAACVLKYDNESGGSGHLEKEKEMWHVLYPEFSSMVKVERWSGSDALVMPHFSTVLESEREQYREEVRRVLTVHFWEKGKVHRDVRWRNIGKYKHRSSGAVTLVVYDLHDVKNYDERVHHDWITNAIQSLYA